MSDSKFEIGDVVRHRVGDDWRGIVIEISRTSSVGEYLVRSRNGNGEFVREWIYEFELTADSEPPSGSPVGAVVPSGGGVPQRLRERFRVRGVG